MLLNTRTIDVDGHVREPESVWEDYLESKYRDGAPKMVRDSHNRWRLLLAGELTPTFPFPPKMLARAGDADPYANVGPKAFKPDIRIKDMDAAGIDAMVIYPSVGLHFAFIKDVPLVTALCRAYNDWMHDFCKDAPQRLISPVLTPQFSLEATLAEIRRGVEQLGFKGAFLRPNPVTGKSFDHPSFEPLWRLLEELDVPLVLHDGCMQMEPQIAMDRYDNFMFRHLICHPFEQQLALLGLICGGVLQKHPKLRVVIAEAGCGWVPYWIERMDHHVREWAHATIPLELAPSEYFKRQCFVSADAEERMVAQVISAIGPDNICFSTDYPHDDHPFDGVLDQLANRKDIPEESRKKILGGNAARAFKI
jgi:predicted TIM-barrel fold metal-dependent hydrolase